MTRLRRLFAISILIVSLTGIALADGGETQGPPAPTPECGTDCSGIEASMQMQTAQDSTVDIVTTADMLAAWFAQMIL